MNYETALFSLLVLLLVFLSSCVVIVDSTNANFQDELYYSSEEYALEDAKDEVAYQQYLKENEVEEESIVHEEELYEEQFDYEDCYDYYYTSRLRRFHSPHLGFGYYNNYYTNSFWYSNNPYNLGVSIYYGYNFWNPWYADPWYNYHFGWGMLITILSITAIGLTGTLITILTLIIILPTLTPMIIIACIMEFVRIIIKQHQSHLQIAMRMK